MSLKATFLNAGPHKLHVYAVERVEFSYRTVDLVFATANMAHQVTLFLGLDHTAQSHDRVSISETQDRTFRFWDVEYSSLEITKTDYDRVLTR